MVITLKKMVSGQIPAMFFIPILEKKCEKLCLNALLSRLII